MEMLFGFGLDFLAADGWSMRGLFSGLTTQEGIIRFCIVMLALGLFIITRK